MKIRAVTFMLQREDGQVLLEWRTDSVFAPGHWSFPGGRLEGSESIYDTLYREMHEELVAEPLAWQQLKPFEYRGWGIQPFLVTAWNQEGEAGAEMIADTGAKLAWFTLDEVMAMPWVPARTMARQVLEQSESDLENW